MKIPKLKLNDGQSIPQIGLGLWQITDEQQFSPMFEQAVMAGYRMFDTAQIYKNEQYLGRSIKSSDLKRQDLYITTKIHVSNFGRKKTMASFDDSLAKLGLDYIDLLLLHFPVTILRKKSWLALQDIQKSGRVKSIGVSNYTIRHLEEMKHYADVTPAVNQVELHLFLQQPELVKYCRDHSIVIEAYSPLAHGKRMDDPLVQKMADKYHKTYAQIMLRFLVDYGMVVIPKTVSTNRLQENINIFDFKLDAKDFEALKSADCNLRTCWNPTMVP